MSELIEFTSEELALVNSFAPQQMKVYLNELLTKKIAEVTARIEQTYCDHELQYFKDVDVVVCNECKKHWEPQAS